MFADPGDESSLGRPLLSFLSQRAVAAEVANGPEPFPRVGSTSTLRSSWRSHSDYLADLLSFGLWSLHDPAVYDAQIGSDADKLVEGTDFIEAGHHICRYYLAALVAEPTFRFQLLATAAAEGDQVIQDALNENYGGADMPWRQLYEEMFRTRGLRLRPGISLDDFAAMVTALMSGYALHCIGDQPLGEIDAEVPRSIFGTAALALLLGCVERADDRGSPGVSVEDAVQELIYGPA